LRLDKGGCVGDSAGLRVGSGVETTTGELVGAGGDIGDCDGASVVRPGGAIGVAVGISVSDVGGARVATVGGGSVGGVVGVLVFVDVGSRVTAASDGASVATRAGWGDKATTRVVGVAVTGRTCGGEVSTASKNGARLAMVGGEPEEGVGMSAVAGLLVSTDRDGSLVALGIDEGTKVGMLLGIIDSASRAASNSSTRLPFSESVCSR
jgi:hypothetical protein